ncbi:MAG TPA: cation transporter [Gemmatimonadaceae bacterium]|nr:cation transporter [Gemmatimonadaceae bacterium]
MRRSARLNLATLAYNALEGIVAIIAGAMVGSIALVGFGLDSVIELAASAAALWRLGADVDPVRRERAEGVSLRIVGALFVGLAAYVAYDAVHALVARAPPRESTVGILLAALSLLVMPLLARAKRRVAVQLGSGALTAEAMQTSLCAYLSAILLAGLVVNGVLGWWWADPVAALAMVPIITREGIEGLRGRSACVDGCG